MKGHEPPHGGHAPSPETSSPDERRAHPDPFGVALPLVLGKRLDDLQTLAKNRLLRGLDMKELGVFFDALDALASPDRSELHPAVSGGAPPHLGFLLEGRARVLRGELEVRALGAGDHYGERSLVALPRTGFTVVAEGPVRIARLTLGRFHTLASHHPRLALHLVQAIVESSSDELVDLADRVRALVHERSLPRAREVEVRVEGVPKTVTVGAPVGEVLCAAATNGRVVAARLDGRPVMLDTPITSAASVSAITSGTNDFETLRRRSLGLAVIDAARAVSPEARVRMRPPLEGASIVEIRAADRRAVASAIAVEMERREAAPLPFAEEMWTAEEARAFFAEHGFTEASRYLDRSRDGTVVLSRCGKSLAIALGPCLPSTRDLGPLRFFDHPNGLVVELADMAGKSPPDVLEAIAAERRSPRYGGSMPEEHRVWLEAFGAASVGALTDLTVEGRLADLVHASEAFHEKCLAKVAEAVVARGGRGAIRGVAVAGPSSSGKTTFIRRLLVELALVGRRTFGLSLDDYYVDRELTPKDEAGELDFESPLAIDTKRLAEHVGRIFAGESVKTSRFDFQSGKSHPEGGPEIRLGPDDLLLVEGLHALEPAMHPPEIRDAMFRVFVHPATTLPLDHVSVLSPTDLRLLRRIVRDRHTRGYRAAETIARWPSVRRGEQRHVFTRRSSADYVFDTSLAYEPCVLKILVERCLLEVGRADAAFPEACRLRELLDPFVSLEPGHVPSASILREFIGEGPR